MAPSSTVGRTDVLVLVVLALVMGAINVVSASSAADDGANNCVDGLRTSLVYIGRDLRIRLCSCDQRRPLVRRDGAALFVANSRDACGTSRQRLVLIDWPSLRSRCVLTQPLDAAASDSPPVICSQPLHGQRSTIT